MISILLLLIENIEMLMHVQATSNLRYLPITKTKLENVKQNLIETNAAKCY